MKFKRQGKNELSINLTPLIDVVFLLLIFFMVTTTFTKETRLAMTLPEAESAQAAVAEAEVIEMVINAAGEFVVNDKQLVNNELDTIKAAISKISAGDNSLPIVVTADANTPHHAVVKAMDAAGQLGFVKVNITTIYPKDAS